MASGDTDDFEKKGMMRMQIAGVRGTGNVTAERLKIDMREEIFLLDPSAAPFTLLASKLRKEKAVNPRIQWQENELVPMWDAINLVAGYLAGDVALIVDNGSYFSIGDLAKVPRTGETMRVSNIVGNTITVERSVGTVAAAALLNDDPLMIMGSSSEEGATARSINTRDPDIKYNYCQILRDPFGITGTLDGTAVYGKKDMNQLRLEMGIAHLRKIELNMLFGERSIDTTGTHPERTMGGLNEWIVTRRTSAAGITEPVFNQFLEGLFENGSDKRFVFACARLCTRLDEWGRSSLHLLAKSDTGGLAIKRYMSSHGELFVVRHRLLTGAIYGGYAMFIDMDNIKYRYMVNEEGVRDKLLRTEIQENSADSRQDEYLSEVSLEAALEKSHGVIYGIT